MPFGIAPAQEEFQRRLNEALQGLDGDIAYDIIAFGVGDTDNEALVDHDRKLSSALQFLLEIDQDISQICTKFQRVLIVRFGEI